MMKSKEDKKLAAIEKAAQEFKPLLGVGCTILKGKGGSFAEAGRHARALDAMRIERDHFKMLALNWKERAQEKDTTIAAIWEALKEKDTFFNTLRKIQTLLKRHHGTRGGKL